MNDLSELIEKVGALTGPSKAVARLVQCSVGGWHRVTPTHARNKNGAYIAPQDWIGEFSDGSPILDQMHGTDMHRDVPDCTASVDAALELVTRALPNAYLNSLSDGYNRNRGVWCCALGGRNDNFSSCVNAPSPAIAIVRAVLAGLQNGLADYSN